MRRYVTQEQRKAENEGVTEDDVNEIKNDISAFRFEMIEIMKASGMNTQGASGASGLKKCLYVFCKIFFIDFFPRSGRKEESSEGAETDEGFQPGDRRQCGTWRAG